MKLISNKDALVHGEYRYWLSRTWGSSDVYGILVWLMLNPSTADAVKDDATIRVVCGRARLLGYKGVMAVNLFALRATSPKVLLTHNDPVGAMNDEILLNVCTLHGDVVCAWGNGGDFLARDNKVLNMLTTKEAKRNGVRLFHLGLTKRGHPKHPLRIPYSQPLIPWKNPTQKI